MDPKHSDNNSGKPTLDKPNIDRPVFDSTTEFGHSNLVRQPIGAPDILSHEQQESLIRYNHITYLLYALSFFTAGLMWIVPIVMNYARRQQADGTWLATHFDWQIKTFWYSIILGILGIIIGVIGLGGLGIGVFADSSNVALGSTALTVVGGIIFLFSIIWHIYRIVKGWIALSDKRPI
ncbi:hypothetical protein MN210_06320 [Psychrobacter raelei]|jgi:uncharacterized membrane protein|uniref:Transmembrane protein n=1 Tax=Psychrobacter raelei TaxID=2565531 RepID=A0AAT9PGW0_9GAMM|nr:hypothetical protein [Psychrobacter sp. PraFG1]UNK06204.1 hypothetical protein MN210_06320 [Psychrobacter sp. PraFG1]